MPVGLEIEGDGRCRIEVTLNNVFSDDFKKSKTTSSLLSLNGKKHITLFGSRSKQPKKLRLTLSDFDNLSQIVISNIHLKNQKLLIKKLEKFKIKGAVTKIEKQKLILKPVNESITLDYQEELNISSTVKFDFLIFIIITILTYLIAYKLTDYLADFSTLKINQE